MIRNATSFVNAHRFFALLSMLVALGVLLSSCWSESSTPKSDSKSNWLARCDSDAECGGFACVCGVCTQGCTNDRQCRVEDATKALCVDPSRDGIASTCAQTSEGSATGAVCFAACETSKQCKDEQRCLRGSCVELGVLESVGRERGPCAVDGTCEDDLVCVESTC